jgi:hypothetical protein
MAACTPVDELIAAADKLQPLATAAQHDLETGDYWSGYDKKTAWFDGMTNGMGGESGDLAGVLSPTVALELCRLLRAEARRLTTTTHPGWQETVSPHAIAIARAINT